MKGDKVKKRRKVTVELPMYIGVEFEHEFVLRMRRILEDEGLDNEKTWEFVKRVVTAHDEGGWEEAVAEMKKWITFTRNDHGTDKG